MNETMVSADSNNWQQRLKTPVAVLLGGVSSERDVSLQSGEAVFQALLDQGVDAVAVDTQEQDWYQQLGSRYEHAFIALHGGAGEDGSIQGALATLGVSFTGSGVLACALALDKLRCKQLWTGMGLPTPVYAVLEDDTDWSALIEQWGAVIVKPAREGSSVGMAKAISAEGLESAYQEARQYDDVVFAEQWIEGGEYTVAVLGDKALPAIKMETDNVFYDYDAKYLSDDTRYHCPCGLSSEQERQLQILALKAFDSLDCKGWGRVDFMQAASGEFLLLEVNTVPGMTSHSLVPMAAKAAGMNFQQLVTEILRLSI